MHHRTLLISADAALGPAVPASDWSATSVPADDMDTPPPNLRSRSQAMMMMMTKCLMPSEILLLTPVDINLSVIMAH